MDFDRTLCKDRVNESQRLAKFKLNCPDKKLYHDDYFPYCIYEV